MNEQKEDTRETKPLHLCIRKSQLMNIYEGSPPEHCATILTNDSRNLISVLYCYINVIFMPVLKPYDCQETDISYVCLSKLKRIIIYRACSKQSRTLLPSRRLPFLIRV